MAPPDIRNEKHLRGKRVLLRADLDVPILSGEVANSFRLDRALETFIFLRDAGAQVVVVGHIGRKPDNSLRPVYDYISKRISLTFVPKVVGPEVEAAVQGMDDGGVCMLENLRSDPRETANDAAFAKVLASYADVYVNDAFAASHREHASIIGVPKLLPGFVGLQFKKEVEGLTPALTPPSPSLCIIGGAKFETKGPLIQKFMKSYDAVFVGGALANDFFKALGYRIGRSLVSKTLPDLTRFLAYNQIVLPKDVLVADSREHVVVKEPRHVEDDDYIYDAGPETGRMLAKMVKRSSFILWNGPLGQYDDGYVEQTEALAKVLIEHNGTTIIGGGDTVAATAKFNPGEKLAFVSTAGGAMLIFLLHGTLPGIEAVVQKQKREE